MQDVKLITEILLQRRTELGVSIAPIDVAEAPADVLFVVRKSPDSSDLVRVLAHSRVLKKGCDYFREVLTKKQSKNQGLVKNVEQKENLEVKEIRENDNMKKIVGNFNKKEIQKKYNIEEIKHGIFGNKVKCEIPRRRSSLIRKPDGEIPRRSKSVSFSVMLEIINIPNDIGEDSEPSVGKGNEINIDINEGNAKRETRDEGHIGLNTIELDEENGEVYGYVNSTDVISSVQSRGRGATCETLPNTPIEEIENLEKVVAEKSDKKMPSTLSSDSIENQREDADGTEIDRSSQEIMVEGTFTAQAMHNPESSGEIFEDNVMNGSYSCINGLEGGEVLTKIEIPLERAQSYESVEEKTWEEENGFVLQKTEWTEAILYGLLEWIYTGSCHIDCNDLPALYSIADRIVLTPLTWCIRKHNSIEYMQLALKNEKHHKSLLKLSVLADCPDLKLLGSMCQALDSYKSRYIGFPKSFLFESAYIHNRENEFIDEGFHTVGGCRFCVLKELKINRENSSDFILGEFPEHVTLLKRDLKLSEIPPGRHIHYGKPNARQVTLHVTVFEEDVPRTCFEFFNYAALCSFKSILKQDCHARQSVRPEVFKLRMVTRFKMGSILEKAITKAIPGDLFVKEVRGVGCYIKGPCYSNSISIVGDPLKILLAAKTIPHDMVGSSALKIRSPSMRTFSSLFCTSNSMGFDLVKKSIHFIKPLHTLIEILEYFTKLNEDAFESIDTQRTIIELVEPTNPF
eukprot:Gb_19825 [translate_table: standard]